MREADLVALSLPMIKTAADVVAALGIMADLVGAKSLPTKARRVGSRVR
jgi:hypothetical protein